MKSILPEASRASSWLNPNLEDSFRLPVNPGTALVWIMVCNPICSDNSHGPCFLLAPSGIRTQIWVILGRWGLHPRELLGNQQQWLLKFPAPTEFPPSFPHYRPEVVQELVVTAYEGESLCHLGLQCSATGCMWWGNPYQRLLKLETCNNSDKPI